MNPVITLNAGGASARLLPHAGGRVSALRLVGRNGEAVDVLHPYPEDFFDPIHWAKGGIYPLMPYSNRIANALLHVNGETHVLRPTPMPCPTPFMATLTHSPGKLHSKARTPSR
jgi:aldose 1-epimerase